MAPAPPIIHIHHEVSSITTLECERVDFRTLLEYSDSGIQSGHEAVGFESAIGPANSKPAGSAGS